MKIFVNPHNLIIEKQPVNEREIDITKCEFEFAEEITNEYVKEAYFTFKGNTYKEIIVNGQCDIPSEVKTEVGMVELGVVAYLVESEEEIKRYNPSPAYFNTWKGSLKDEVENSEPITPSEMEQFEQALEDGLQEVANVDIDASKVGNTATIEITNRYGTTKSVEIYDGEQGPQGPQGIQGPAGQDGKNGTNGRDGIDGKDGKDGTNGEDAKINGVNTLNIVAGDNITINQQGSTLTINSTGGGSGAVSSVNGQTGDVVLAIPSATSDLTNDSDFTTKTYVDGLVGSINSALDLINGEVI